MGRTRGAPIVPFVISALVAGTVACAGRNVATVSPQEAPGLAARLAKEPSNQAILSRYSAALFAASKFDSAQAVAKRALALDPSDAIATLVLGQTLERSGQYDQAVATYQRFSTEHARVKGAGAVRGRELLARRDQATASARAAMRREQELAQQPGDPQTVAVLPVEIVGDSSYQPLSRGLAQMMISDLALLQRFRMVERVQIGAVMDELKFSQNARVDPSSAARVGRLVQAGRMVQSSATIPKSGPVRIQANLVQRSGEVANGGQVNGTMRGLLTMEKELIVQLASGLGYQLAEAERRRILENGTQNLQAFLSYSRGLLAEDAGDFSRAALYYGEAVQADPQFQAARDQQQANAAASGGAGSVLLPGKSPELPRGRQPGPRRLTWLPARFPPPRQTSRRSRPKRPPPRRRSKR